jgi:hypothetical protein
MLQRNSLIERIARMRRQTAAGDSPPGAETPPTGAAELSALERRVAHLEQLVVGLQDSVHRESSRQSKQLEQLESQLEPAALAIALEEDARRRGL